MVRQYVIRSEERWPCRPDDEVGQFVDRQLELLGGLGRLERDGHGVVDVLVVDADLGSLFCRLTCVEHLDRRDDAAQAVLIQDGVGTPA